MTFNANLQSSGPTNTRFETREMMRMIVGTAVKVRESGHSESGIEASRGKRDVKDVETSKSRSAYLRVRP